MKYKNILFDLDGTISDSSPGIINAYQYSLNKMGFPQDDPELIKSYIGSPLRSYYSEEKKLGASDSESAVKFFREYYTDKGIFENNLYEKMDELIGELHNNGNRLFIATSKPLEFALRILNHFKVKEYFTSIHGSDMSVDNKPKDKLISDAIIMNGLAKEESVMIGDRYHDIRGAKTNGIDSIAVTFGFGSRAEIEAENPDHIAANSDELKNIIFG